MSYIWWSKWNGINNCIILQELSGNSWRMCFFPIKISGYLKCTNQKNTLCHSRFTVSSRSTWAKTSEGSGWDGQLQRKAHVRWWMLNNLQEFRKTLRYSLWPGTVIWLCGYGLLLFFSLFWLILKDLYMFLNTQNVSLPIQGKVLKVSLFIQM